jgi:hypothetical protein
MDTCLREPKTLFSLKEDEFFLMFRFGTVSK